MKQGVESIESIKYSQGSIILRMRTLLLLLVFMWSGLGIAHASILEYDQGEIIADFERFQGGNTQIQFIVGSVGQNPDNVSNGTGPSIVAGGEVFFYDTKLEYDQLNNPVFLYFETFEPGEQLTFVWVYSGVSRMQNVTLNEAGNYFFRFSPDELREQTTLYIDLIDPVGAIALRTQEQKNLGPSSFIKNTVNFIEELMLIVVSFWRLLYYLFIFVVVIGSLAVFVGLAFKVLEWAEKFREKREKYLYKGRNGR